MNARVTPSLVVLCPKMLKSGARRHPQGGTTPMVPGTRASSSA